MWQTYVVEPSTAHDTAEKLMTSDDTSTESTDDSDEHAEDTASDTDSDETPPINAVRESHCYGYSSPV